jgi:hypothetical protein
LKTLKAAGVIHIAVRLTMLTTILWADVPMIPSVHFATTKNWYLTIIFDFGKRKKK